MGDEYGLDPGPGQGPIYYPGDPNFPLPAPPTPPPQNYPTGPAKRPAPYSQSRPAAAPPPDPWAGVPGSVRDQAVALVDKFLSAAGWPSYVDAHQAALGLAKSGLNLTASPYDAYEWLYMNSISGAVRDNQPWARYGMLKDEYNQVTAKLSSVFFDWTGDTMNNEIMPQAIRGGWTPDEIRNWAMYGNPSGTGELLGSAQMGGEMPWLSAGQSYSQTLQGFQSFEQHAPTDRATLAAWFRFGVSAKQLGAGPGATGRPTQQKEQMSEVR